MDWNAISTFIGTMGFPIVACCAMFYLYNNTITNLMSTLAKINTTLAMICDKLDLEDEHE